MKKKKKKACGRMTLKKTSTSVVRNGTVYDTASSMAHSRKRGAISNGVYRPKHGKTRKLKKTEAESVPDENNINNTHLHKYKLHGQSRAHFTPEGNVIVGTLQEK